ncbi:hypothetical protein ACFY1J_31080 [Streptomyces sp. NPDC001406]|uniref:hypothetical protein n=1 Tax=Streptomyces sp. NPDC001406 TaxID=3364572 RepID=UPI0036A40D2F
MDQGVAAVWAAGLGIAGTLLGAFGGAWVQARTTRAQVVHQEWAEVRLRIRDERRAAYAAVLEHYDRSRQATSIVLQYRTDHGVRHTEVPEDLRRDERVAVETFQRAVMDVAIAGPERMTTLADEIAAAIWDRVIAVANGQLDYEARVRDYNNSTTRGMNARIAFVEEARRVLSAPDRPVQ